jgi:glycosyltransferase involved in cell wall biosynthesis
LTPPDVPAPGSAGAGTVAVSMPYYRSLTTVRRAVQAVLAQTHTDLTLYVINDGDTVTPPWPALAGITDPRLIRIDLPANRGRYFCDAAVIAAADRESWIAIHDADDWAEPDWLATLLAACDRPGVVAAVAPQHVHGRTVVLEPVREPMRAAPARMRHLAHHAAVCRAEVARRIGGHPGYRIGFDSLWTNVLTMLGDVAVVDRPLYHRQIRPDSLTTAAATRHGSPARHAVRRSLNRLYRLALAADDPARVIRDDVPTDLADLVAEAAQGIRDGTLAADAGKGTPMASIVDNRNAWGGWALDPYAAQELAAHLDRTRPPSVVESGSGASTILLAEYAQRTGAHVVSLEHHRTFGAVTEQQLRLHGLASYVDLRQSDLVDLTTPAGIASWYAARMPDQVDFALIDGPPGHVGRAAAMFALEPCLRGDWRVWLDDAHRDGEIAAVAAWTGAMAVQVEYVDLPRGLAVLRPDTSASDRRPVDASDVAVTLVTGGRADLLAKTLGSLDATAPGLLQSAHVAVLQNGVDPATTSVLDAYGDLWDHRVVVSQRLPIGQTASAMLGHPAPRTYVLHLEDDWLAATTVPGWLDRARAALNDPRIGQVRLRHRGDRVLSRHMVTRQPIDWQPGPDGHVTAHAHYTLNPSLMRAEDTPKIWDADDGETGAMRRFVGTGMLTAQAVPGVFQHLGDGHSLRLGQRQ